MYFFTADEHYGHENIIRYCRRPFEDVKEMDRELIARHNDIVEPEDTVIHAGDFTLKGQAAAAEYVKQLNGRHVFLRGSHDEWLGGRADAMWEKTIDANHIVVCHYAMRVWPGSHYNSWQLYGHSHGRLAPVGKQWDIGVDNNNFYPVSFKKLIEIMRFRADNEGMVEGRLKDHKV